MTDLTLKFNLLEPDAKRQVLDFMEFLLSKKMKSEEPVKTAYKKKILKVYDKSEKENISEQDLDRLLMIIAEAL